MIYNYHIENLNEYQNNKKVTPVKIHIKNIEVSCNTNIHINSTINFY